MSPYSGERVGQVGLELDHSQIIINSEHDEGLSNVALDSLLLDSDHVEPHGLGEGAALTHSDDIAGSDTGESRGQVGGQVVVPLLESVVLLDIVEVVSAEDDGSGHLGGKHDTLEDSATDGHIGGEGALLVDVLSLDGRLRGLESEADLLVVPGAGGGLLGEDLLGVVEDSDLFLISSFGLNVSHLF